MFLFLCWLQLLGAVSQKRQPARCCITTPGDRNLAIETAKQGLAKDPNDAEAYFQLGVAYSQLDSVGEAYHDFTKAAELDPKREKLANDNIQSNFAKHYNRALNLSRDENVQAAAAEFEKATQADPRQAKGHFMLGSAYERMGVDDPSYYPKAIEALDQVLDLSTPGRPPLHRRVESRGRDPCQDGAAGRSDFTF